MAKVLTIACKKGGTAKTTVATQLAACLAEQGGRVLIVDLDSQHNATNALDETEATDIVELFRQDNDTLDAVEDTTVSLRDSIRKTGWIDGAVDLVPGSKKLAGAEGVGFENAFNLQRSLEALRDDYDWILIDTGPSTGLVTTAALLASDRVLIPVEVQSEDAISGMVETYKLAKKLGNTANPGLSVVGIVLSRKQHRRNVCEAIEEEIRSSPLGKLLFPVAIREATILQQARKARLPLSEFAPTAPVLKDFRDVTHHLTEAWDAN